MYKYILTKHAMERYSERINFNHKEITKAMIKDLRALKNKRIINIGDKQYVFFKNYREFVIQKKPNGTAVVITVIKHKRDEKEKAIEKRLREKEEYESNKCV